MGKRSRFWIEEFKYVTNAELKGIHYKQAEILQKNYTIVNKKTCSEIVVYPISMSYGSLKLVDIISYSVDMCCVTCAGT